MLRDQPDSTPALPKQLGTLHEEGLKFADRGGASDPMIESGLVGWRTAIQGGLERATGFGSKHLLWVKLQEGAEFLAFHLFIVEVPY